MDKTDRQLLEGIYKKMGEFVQWQATVEERCANRKTEIDGHRHTLYGPDGRDGIVQQANSNSEFISSFKAWNLRVFGAAIIAALIAAASLILNLWKTHQL